MTLLIIIIIVIVADIFEDDPHRAGAAFDANGLLDVPIAAALCSASTGGEDTGGDLLPFVIVHGPAALPVTVIDGFDGPLVFVKTHIAAAVGGWAIDHHRQVTDLDDAFFGFFNDRI